MSTDDRSTPLGKRLAAGRCGLFHWPVQEKVKTLCYDVPLRDGFNAQLVLPYNLTQQECDRLQALLQTLVIPK